MRSSRFIGAADERKAEEHLLGTAEKHLLGTKNEGCEWARQITSCSVANGFNANNKKKNVRETAQSSKRQDHTNDEHTNEDCVRKRK